MCQHVISANSAAYSLNLELLIPIQVHKYFQKYQRGKNQIKVCDEQVSVVMWLAPWPPVRETRVQIPEQHGKVYPGLGILQPQWNPYPTLTPPSC